VLENTNTGCKYLGGIASPYIFSSFQHTWPEPFSFYYKRQKNNHRKSNNSCQSVSKFQFMKASSKLIQPLFHLTIGLLMKLVQIAGIPNTVVKMEFYGAAYISHCAKHPLSHYKIKPVGSCVLRKSLSSHCRVYQFGTTLSSNFYSSTPVLLKDSKSPFMTSVIPHISFWFTMLSDCRIFHFLNKFSISFQ